MEKIIHYLEIGIVVFPVLSLTIFLIMDTIRTHKKNRIPVENDRAVATYKHPETEMQTVSKSYGIRNEWISYITFETESSGTVTLFMNTDHFNAIEEGSRGILTWEGERFCRFDPDF